MKYTGKIILLIAASVLVATLHSSREAVFADDGLEQQASSGLVKFSFGDDITFTLDTLSAVKTDGDGFCVLTNAITDFTFPVSGMEIVVDKSFFGGDEAVNSVEIVDVPGDKRSVLIFRFAKKGVGGGEGKIGTSVVIAATLNTDLLSPIRKNPFAGSAKGELTDSGDEMDRLMGYIKADIEKVGAKAPRYLGIAGPSRNATYYNGFILFDPTNPDSYEDAYFEFLTGENTHSWSIEPLK